MAKSNVAELKLSDKIPHGLLSTLNADRDADPLLLLWESMTRLETLNTIASDAPELFKNDRTLGGLLLQLDDATKLLGMALETLSAGKACPDYTGAFVRRNG